MKKADSIKNNDNILFEQGRLYINKEHYMLLLESDKRWYISTTMGGLTQFFSMMNDKYNFNKESFKKIFRDFKINGYIIRKYKNKLSFSPKQSNRIAISFKDARDANTFIFACLYYIVKANRKEYRPTINVDSCHYDLFNSLLLSNEQLKEVYLRFIETEDNERGYYVMEETPEDMIERTTALALNVRNNNIRFNFN